MARQVLPIAGAVVGGVIGQAVGAQVGFALGSLVGNAIDPLEVMGNKVGDSATQAASDGGARAVVFGKGCIRATCVLARGNRVVKKQRNQAGKGGGPVTINQRVYWTFAIGLGEDLVGGTILRIWEGEKLVYDVTPTSAIPEDTAAFAQRFRFYDGAEDQLPDPDLEVIYGIGNTPYHRGTAYVVFPNFDLTDYQESIPTYRWEVASAGDAVPAPVMVINSATSIETAQSLVAANGQDWSGTYRALPYARGLMAGQEGFLVWSVSGAVSTSDDQGATWTERHVAGGTWGAYGQYANGQYVVCGGARLLHAPEFAGPWVESLMSGHDQIGAYDITHFQGAYLATGVVYPVVYRSASLDGPWTVVDLPDLLSAPARRISAGELTCYVAGGGFGGPKLMVTGTGVSFGSVLTPSIPGAGRFTAVRYNPANGYWVAGTDNGRVVYKAPEGVWTLSTFVANGFITDIGCNGFIFIMSVSNADVIGKIATSETGAAWTVQRSDRHLYERVASHVSAQSHADKVVLGEVVQALHARAGHTPIQVDVSELTDLISGVVIETTVNGSEAISSLVSPFFADPSDYDGKIHYIKRGKPVVRTLTVDDLIDEPDASLRENSIEYPRKLHLFFQPSFAAYATTKATSTRSSPDVLVTGEASVSIPVTFDEPNEPAQIAAKLHKVFWTDAEGEITWVISDAHLDLVNADTVGLSLRGVVRRARIVSIEDDPGQRKLTMKVDRQSAYTSQVTGVPVPPPTPPRPAIPAATINVTLDLPALQDSDDLLLYYDAMSGASDEWAGAALQRSLDGGANFQTVDTVTLNSIIGSLQAAMTAALPCVTDTTNSILVQFYTSDEVNSISQSQFLSEGGALAIKDAAGAVEVIQARDADDLGNGLYRLSYLQRGRLNTPAGAHAVGSKVVILDGSVRRLAAQTAWLGAALTHRAVSNGQSPETAAQDTITYTGASQREWPVANILLERSGATIGGHIVPRHRFGTDDAPVRSGNWDHFDVELTDGANSAALSTESADFTFDATGWSTPIRVTVYQVNRLTGRGPGVTEDIA